jgi:tetratricopeptide (TPR) repeat protein
MTTAPSPAGQAVRRGLALAQQGDHERAIAAFTEALRLDPELAEAYVRRGDALRFSGDYERAAEDYSAALRIEPHNVRAAVQRGLLYRLAGRHEEAVEDFTTALARDPGNAAAYYHRGNARADLGTRGATPTSTAAPTTRRWRTSAASCRSTRCSRRRTCSAATPTP